MTTPKKKRHKPCWACRGNGAVTNWAGAPIECPICTPGDMFYGYTKKQYLDHYRKRP